MHTLNTTADKYYKLLMYLYKKESVRSIIGVLKNHQVTTTLNTLLQKRNLITKHHGAWKWIGGKPTIEMAKDILQRCNAIVRSYQRSRSKFTPTTRKFINVQELYAERKELLDRVHKIDLIISTAKTLR